jgi:hypothetical protein
MKKTFKEFLKPSGYSEGPMSLVTHLGVVYKLDRIFELSIDLPVTQLSLDSLKWLTDVSITDPAREKNADIKVPIIVTPHNGNYVIIDGLHRAVKALKAGEKTIPARVIFHDILAMARFGSGPSVGFASNVNDLNGYLKEGRSQRYVNQDEWEDNYPQDIGSAFEMWMSENRKNEMWKEYFNGADFKSKYFEFTGDKDKFWAKIEKWEAEQKLKGWEEFADDENSDGREFILIKKSK